MWAALDLVRRNWYIGSELCKTFTSFNGPQCIRCRTILSTNGDKILSFHISPLKAMDILTAQNEIDNKSVS